jgi:uncharacterized protein HemX
MQINSGWQQLNRPRGSGRSQIQAVLLRVFAVLAGLVMAAASLIAFAFVALAGLAAGGYLWWKTRHVRAQVKQAQEAYWQHAEAARTASSYSCARMC